MSTAQHPSISFTPGLGTIAGETTKFIQDPTEYGFDYQIKVIHPLTSQRFNLVFDHNFSTIRHFVSNANGIYEATGEQSFWGIGARYYIFHEVVEYRPYWGMVAPYVGLKAGRFGSLIAEVKRNTANFNVIEEPQVQIAPRLSLGIAFGIANRWMIDASVHFTYDSNDGSDGIIGNTPYPDIWVNGGIGLQYDFGHWFEITQH